MNESMIKYLVGSTMIKYEQLDELFKDIQIANDQVVIHLDAWHIFKRFFRDDITHFFTTVPEEILVQEIVVGFINIIAHYRKYVAAKLHKDNVILVYFNPGKSIYHTAFNREYKAKMVSMIYDKNHKDYIIINSVLSKSVNMLMDFITRIEGVYWIHNYGIDTPTAVCYTINTPAYKDSFHIVISRDEQYAELISDNFIQFCQRRKYSKLITKNNFTENVFAKPVNKGVITHLTPKSMKFYFALNGCSDVGIKQNPIGRGPTVISRLNELYRENLINDNSSIQTVINELEKKYKNYKDNLENNYDRIVTRYKMYDLWLSARSISKTSISHMFHSHFDLYDQGSLEKLNQLLADINIGDIIHLNDLNMNKAVIWNK